MIRLYYWNTVENVGDYYGYYLTKKLYPNDRVEWSNIPNLAVCGSILGHPCLNNDTIVWGCGLHNLFDNEKCYITNKNNFKAVRGRLTADKLGLENVVLGDTGLLASYLYKPDAVRIKKKFCILTHWRDYENIKKIYGSEIDVINMGDNNVEEILNKINKYEFILSSSLHGIIFAHSYGIPAIHIKGRNWESDKDFKYKDYYSVLDIKYKSYKLQYNLLEDLKVFNTLYKERNLNKPSQNLIEKIQNKLLACKPTELELNKKYNNVICAIAKSENSYINDWVNYHIGIGVEHIYLFDNNDSKTSYVGNFIDKKDKVTIFNIRNIKRKGLQLICYNNFYKYYNESINWITYIDIDEFIFGVNNINNFLKNEKFRDFESIRIKWKLFGDDDLITRDMKNPIYKDIKKPILNNSLSNQGKCIVRGGLKNICVGSCHFAFRGDWDIDNLENRDLNKIQILRSCLPSGKECFSKISINENYDDESVFINHYMTKTISEFVQQKLARGDACFDSRNIDFSYFWNINKKTKEKMDYIFQYKNLLNKKDSYSQSLVHIVSRKTILNTDNGFTGLPEEYWKDNF